MKKKILIISISVLLVVAVAITVSVVAIRNSYMPEIKQGEFPFALTYKINGEEKTVNDTYVCEFDGIGFDTGRGFYREWKGYVKSSGAENVLIAEDENRKIYCQVGEPNYYMGDHEYLDWETISLSPPHLYAEKKTDSFDYMSADEIKETYNIEIVSWDFKEPISNEF